jgi:hypothetical protein
MTVKLPPKWKFANQQGDSNGYLRGARGYGAGDETDRAFMKPDKSLSAKLYGREVKWVRIDGGDNRDDI